MPTCSKCGKESVVRFKVLSEKLCGDCYGPTSQKEIGATHVPQPFDSYYDHALGSHCQSYTDQERKVKEFNKKQADLPPNQKDPQHPDGFTFLNDNHKFMRELRHMHRHGKEYREMRRKKFSDYREDRKLKEYVSGRRVFSYSK